MMFPRCLTDPNKRWAHDVLDAVAGGQYRLPGDIDRALRILGDLA